MPDLYIATGSKSGFGLNANAILSLNQLTNNSMTMIEPYIGLGLGYNNVGDLNKLGTNIVLGASFNVLGGNVYADYTARNFIDIHQLSIGYKFGF